MDENIKLDYEKLHNEIKSVLARQKELLAEGINPSHRGFEITQGLRSGWDDLERALAHRDKTPTKSDELAYLSARMTVLCSIKALGRGRRDHISADGLWKNHYKYKVSYMAACMRGAATPARVQEALVVDEWKQFLIEEEHEQVA